MNPAEKLEPQQNTVTEVAPGIWLIDVPTPEDAMASRCGHLVPPLVEASKHGRLVVVARLHPQQRSVDIGMPTFWLDAFTRKGAKVSAIERSRCFLLFDPRPWGSSAGVAGPIASAIPKIHASGEQSFRRNE